MNTKKLFSTLAAVIIFCGSVFQVFSAPTSSPAPSAPTNSTAGPNTAAEKEQKSNSFPEPQSEAALLIDRKTGDILYEKNKSEKLYPASTTKIMTAVLALEQGNLQDVITATQEAIEPITNKHSHMGIKVGESFTLEQLLYGMLVYSANDAANVIAVHIGGNLESFVNMMNQKASELELLGTHYKNAHGFHDDEHYTTAEDLAKLARYAMQNEKFAEIVKTTIYRIPGNNLYTQERVLSTTNHLISRYRNTNYFYKYAIGIKTGFTDEAGNCLVSAATKGNIELIGVILKAEQSTDGTLYAFQNSIDLYNYAFENYKYFLIASSDDIISDSAVYEAKNNTRVALCPSKSIEKLLPAEIDEKDITFETEFTEKIKAPIKKGDILGHVVYSCRGEEVGSADLIAGNDVEKDMLLASIHLIIAILTSPLFLIPALIIIILLIISGNNRRQKRKRRRSKLKYTNYDRY